MKKAGAIIAGLLIALVGQFLALGLAGGGHGWNTPFFVSVILWIAYPMVLIRAFRSANLRSVNAGPAALLAALIADASLVLMTFEEGLEYFTKIIRIEGTLNAFLWIGAWVLIWLGWQAVALLNFLRANARRTA